MGLDLRYSPQAPLARTSPSSGGAYGFRLLRSEIRSSDPSFRTPRIEGSGPILPLIAVPIRIRSEYPYELDHEATSLLLL